MSWDDPETVFDVVMNHEEQYSIWPTYRDIPAGWSAVGKRGHKQECLEHIEQVWTDMRPLSLRKHMESQAARSASDPAE
ncbi:MAG: MbtH family NRPS accessory protein [Polyangiales bacterium]